MADAALSDPRPLLARYRIGRARGLLVALAVFIVLLVVNDLISAETHLETARGYGSPPAVADSKESDVPDEVRPEASMVRSLGDTVKASFDGVDWSSLGEHIKAGFQAVPWSDVGATIASGITPGSPRRCR